MINILEYGAVGDGQTNDAPVIQKAIDTCAEQGGGVVLFPGGRTYSSGYVLLKSNVEVHLEPGAVWKASSNIDKWEVHMHFGTHSPGLIETYDDAIAILCRFHSIRHHIFLCYLQHRIAVFIDTLYLLPCHRAVQIVSFSYHTALAEISLMREQCRMARRSGKTVRA